MRAVYKKGVKDPVWADLDPFASSQKDKETLVKEIRGQVDKGETVIASQPMNELVG
jgi:hypothetical protein